MKNSKLNKNNTMMSYMQLCLILTIFILLSLSSACAPAITPTDNNDEKNVFTPSEHIVITDDTSSDAVLGLTIELDENDSTKIIISGLVNTIGAEDKTYTLTIAPVEDSFSTPEDRPITIIITEPTGLSPIDGGLTSRGFTITNVNDEGNPIDYTVVVPFSGAPVVDWFNTDYISATFASQAASLTLNENTLSINGLTNVSDGTGTISFTLPTGFVASPNPITLTDPDGPLTDTATITLDPNTFTISETDNSANNSKSYTVSPINLSNLVVFTAGEHIVITDDSIADPTLNDITNTLSIGVNTANLITISGLSNALTDKTYTLTIAPVPGIFSTSSGSDITIPIREPDDFSPGDGVLSLSDSFTITNDIDSIPIDYTVVVPFTGAPVEDWFDTTYISASFASQTASLTLDGDTLSVNGLYNAINGTGSIDFTLPPGFVASLNPIPLTDPDGAGTDQNTITLSPDTFTISETDNSANNSKTYTVNPINLKNLIVFTADEHIKVSDGSTDITNSLSIELDENDSTKIIISGLVNTIGSDKTYTLTIAPVEDGFSTSSGADITITITEPLGFSPGDGSLTPSDSFTITNDIDSIEIIYTVEVPFTGAPVEDWFDTNNINVSYNSQAASLMLSNYVLSVNDLTNVSGETGSIDFTLPSGFVANPSSFPLPDPAGTDTDTITLDPNTFTISETDNSANNSKTYTVNPINLKNLIVFTADEHIVITDDTSSDRVLGLTIGVNNSNQITITGLSNTIGADKTYTLTIAPVVDGFSTPENSPITITITEPLGFSPRPGVLTPSDSFTITNDIDSIPITYTVVVPFTGAPVEDWFDTNNINVSYNSQAASLMLSNKALSVNDLANVGGTGSIGFILPYGFVANPESITFTVPDGAGTGETTTTLSQATFIISEVDNSDNNSQEYTVNPISLGNLNVFTPGEHIKLSNSFSLELPELFIGVDENDSTKIIIRGISKSQTNITYTVTIEPVQGIFSTPGDNTITFSFTEDPQNISPQVVDLSPSGFIITNDIDTSNPITYTVKVQYSGAPVEYWFNTAFISATFASPQAASLTLDGYTLSVNGLTNAIDGTGSIVFYLPNGFVASRNPIPLIDPDGDGTGPNTITLSPNNFTISETNNIDNSKTYTVEPINLN